MIVANGHQPVTPVKMLDIPMFLHGASIGHYNQIAAQVTAAVNGATSEELHRLLDDICEEVEQYRGAVDASLCDVECDILQPLIRRHIDGYLGDTGERPDPLGR